MARSTEETGGIQKKIEATVVARRVQPWAFVKVASRRRCAARSIRTVQEPKDQSWERSSVREKNWEQPRLAVDQEGGSLTASLKVLQRLETEDRLICANQRVQRSTIWRSEIRSTYSACCVW